MKSNQKGMTIVEVVVSFSIVALAIGIGLLGIGVSANFMNNGAALKNQQRSKVVSDMTQVADATVTINGNSVDAEHFVVTDAAGNVTFEKYEAK
jgi:uncharacterized protein YdeI (BOF family)